MPKSSHRGVLSGDRVQANLRFQLRPRFNGARAIHAIGVICLLAAGPTAWAAPTKYEVKAAFLLSFAQFVEWLPSAFGEPDAPFCIGVLGDDPFGQALDQVVEGEKIHNHKVTIKRSAQLQDLRTCQIVFIAASERERVPEILESLKAKDVLTVSEVNGFSNRGGMINFYEQEGKVRFEINRLAAERQHLKISNRLLQVGKVVDDGVPKAIPTTSPTTEPSVPR